MQQFLEIQNTKAALLSEHLRVKRIDSNCNTSFKLYELALNIVYT